MKTTLDASKKRVLKLVLDAIMLILLVLMYRKQAVSMAFRYGSGRAGDDRPVRHPPPVATAGGIAATTKRFFSRREGYVRAAIL
jgi:hypothetical protein